MHYDEIGPEAVYSVYDPVLKFHGWLVVDSTRRGTCGGGARMTPDVTVEEVASLARGMTCKFAIMGLPRGGSKAGIAAPPLASADHKRAILRAFGSRIAPLLKDREVAVGPDMGVNPDEVQEIYAGAGLTNPRSGLFQKIIDSGDEAAYHLTGRGVATAAVVAARHAKVAISGCSAIVEGFGQVGVGTCRYLNQEGVRIVAVSTLAGAVYDDAGLDIEALMRLRHEHGDNCVLEYSGGTKMDSKEIYYLPAEILVPGARPYSLDAEGVQRLRCKIVCPGANIAVTRFGIIELHRRNILHVPDYISNAGGMLATWVDFLGGTFEQAMSAIQRRIGTIADEVLRSAGSAGIPPRVIADQRVLAALRTAPTPRPLWEEIQPHIRAMLLGE